MDKAIGKLIGWFFLILFGSVIIQFYWNIIAKEFSLQMIDYRIAFAISMLLMAAGILLNLSNIIFGDK